MAWVEPEAWYESLATFYAATGALITDPDGRVLLVKPNYRDHWAFPGGIVEADEAPHESLAREINEELGLKIEVGQLLVVDWSPPLGKRPKAIVYFLFDAGAIEGTDALVIQTDEIEAVGLFTPDEATQRLPNHIGYRIAEALGAKGEGFTRYPPN